MLFWRIHIRYFGLVGESLGKNLSFAFPYAKRNVRFLEQLSECASRASFIHSEYYLNVSGLVVKAKSSFSVKLLASLCLLFPVNCHQIDKLQKKKSYARDKCEQASQASWWLGSINVLVNFRAVRVRKASDLFSSFSSCKYNEQNLPLQYY